MFSYKPKDGQIGQVSILQGKLKMLPPLKEEISGNRSWLKSTQQDNSPDNSKWSKEPGNVVWQLSVEDNTYKLKGLVAMWFGYWSYYTRSLCCSKESPDQS